MEQIWNSILDLMARFITPDWGALVALIPVAIMAMVVLFIAWLLWRVTRLGPKRRGKGKVKPLPPPGVHMPGPTRAPLFGAVGVALLLFGLVFGGLLLALGFAVLVLGLLYWGAEAMRDYDHTTGAQNRLPAVIHEGPPAGVHLPGPSFRPFVGAVAVAALLFGLVFGGWLLAVGFIMLVISLVGWLRDARAEYNLTEQADRTGHLESMPAPRVPRGTFAVFGALFGLGLILNSGLIPSGAANGASGSPGPSGSAATSLPPTDATEVAQGAKFSTTALTATAGKPLTILFVNKDAGVPHDMAFADTPGATVFAGAKVTGVATAVYSLPALPAGAYTFKCTFHPTTMVGALTVK